MYTHMHKYLQTYIHIHTHQTLEGMCSDEFCRLKGKIRSLILVFLFLVRTWEHNKLEQFFSQRIVSEYKMVCVKAILHLAKRISRHLVLGNLSKTS